MRQAERMAKLLRVAEGEGTVERAVDQILMEKEKPKAKGKGKQAPPEEKPQRKFDVELSIDVDERMVLDELNRFSGTKFSAKGRPKSVQFPVKASIMATTTKEAQSLVLDIIRKVSEKSRFISGASYRLYKEK